MSIKRLLNAVERRGDIGRRVAALVLPISNRTRVTSSCAGKIGLREPGEHTSGPNLASRNNVAHSLTLNDPRRLPARRKYARIVLQKTTRTPSLAYRSLQYLSILELQSIAVAGEVAGDSRGHGGFLYSLAFHLLLGRVYEDKDVQERIVRRSKLDWVIVRPVILTDGPKTNAYRALVDPRDWTCGFISRADVADFLVKQIDDNAFLHKTPVLTS
jgi:hypothetical protein